MKAWREIAVPHPDVLEGTFLQSEFAADITAVRTNRATPEYQDAKAFYQRTFITDGMRRLLIQVAQRLASRNGEPVIQLQTAFGGGKTHTLLAVYHLAKRKCALKDLAGIPEIIDAAGLMDVPQANVAVLDGNERPPSEAWKHGKTEVRTMWGEMAWQLGGEKAFELVKESDAAGKAPGKEKLRQVLEMCAPCVVLIDELVAYVRQFGEGEKLTGGSYDSNLSFANQLTEAAKQVPNAIVLASLPESEVEAGSQHGQRTLKALEKVFARVQALWKPVSTEEAFEIVRRRLFEPLRDEKGRDQVCRAFADAYVQEGAKLPGETQEGRYYDRLVRAYPIHPEIFDRLYEDWTTIDGFQRTRGVLKLMAKVIYRLWKADNRDFLIMPGSLPLADGETRNELTYYLTPGWDAVIERDIDGEKAESTELESRETRFGAVNAARRVARTLFLGTAPASAATKPGIRGLDRARTLLGCVQPGQSSALYSDALNRLLDRCHFLNASGDKTLDNTRFWFDTRANLRREMEDRKRRFEDKNEVRTKLAEVMKRVTSGATMFDGVHVFTPHADVPDDSGLRLVILPPEAYRTKEDSKFTDDAVMEYIRPRGTKPRHRANRLLFLAPDQGSLQRVRDAVRVALAWKSIVDDITDGKLNIDQLQRKQAEKEAKIAEDVLPRAARECFKWLVCPGLSSPTEQQVTIEAFALNTSAQSLGSEIERVSTENEWVILAWSPVHLRTRLKELYWKADKPAVSAQTFWEDSQRYLYLPRLKDRSVLEGAIYKGAATRDFFGTAYGQNGADFEGFHLGDAAVQVDDTLLLIEPEAARKYEEAMAAKTKKPTGKVTTGGNAGSQPEGSATTQPQPGTGKPATAKHKFFHASADVPPATAKMRLVQLAEEIVNVLASDPNASVQVTLEVSAEFPNGVTEHVKRSVSENAASLRIKDHHWE